MSKTFKPQLLPNFGVGVIVDWDQTIPPNQVPNYIASQKKDGNRFGLNQGVAKGRSLKPIRSLHIQQMAKDFLEKYPTLSEPDMVVEGEFYAHGFTFPEIQHFFSSADVEAPHKRRELELLWGKTNGGTDSYSATEKGRIVEKFWEFPGRDVDWLCTWQPELKFHIFDFYDGDPSVTKLERYIAVDDVIGSDCIYAEVIPQFEFENMEQIKEFYEESLDEGYEGLVIIHKDSPYKLGRYTLKQAMAFKMKDDCLPYDGVIIGVPEGDQIKEGIARGVNELGNSTTSALKEDREPNGRAKGFNVELADGKTLIVSLKGYSNGEKVGLLVNASEYIGRSIRFTAMAPVKENGVPRHAFFTRGNFRDSK